MKTVLLPVPALKRNITTMPSMSTRVEAVTWHPSLHSTHVPNSELEEPVFEGHVVLRLQSNAGTENVDKGTSLLCQSIDNWCARWRQRSLHTISSVHLAV